MDWAGGGRVAQSEDGQCLNKETEPGVLGKRRWCRQRSCSRLGLGRLATAWSAEAWGQIPKGDSAARCKKKTLFPYGAWGGVCWWGYMQVSPGSYPYSCWEGLRMYRKWVLRGGSLAWEELWVPSSRLSSRVPSRSPSRMACRRCRFSLSQRPLSWASWWNLRRGSFMIQKATRGWGSWWKLSWAFGTGTMASFSSILCAWGEGTRRPSGGPNDNLKMLSPHWHIQPTLPPTGHFTLGAKISLCGLQNSWVYKCFRIKNTLEVYGIRWDRIQSLEVSKAVWNVQSTSGLKALGFTRGSRPQLQCVILDCILDQKPNQLPWTALGPVGTSEYRLNVYLALAIWSVGCGPAASASSESFLDMQISGPHRSPDLLNQSLHFSKIPRWLLCTVRLEEHCFIACFYHSKVCYPSIWHYIFILA